MSSASLISDPILVSYHDSIVRLSNLKTLDDSSWLDDNIITFAFEYIQYESKYVRENHKLFAFVTPPVVQLLKMSDNSFAEQLLQSIDFLDKVFLILPINDNTQVTKFGGSHWSVLILCIQGIVTPYDCNQRGEVFFFSERTLYHFDSMSLANHSAAREVQSKLEAFFHENLSLVNCRCPQQNNGFDCGLYLIVIVEEFCRFIGKFHPLKTSTERKFDKSFFDEFSDEIMRYVTSVCIDQRRRQLKTLLESMRMDRKI